MNGSYNTWYNPNLLVESRLRQPSGSTSSSNFRVIPKSSSLREFKIDSISVHSVDYINAVYNVEVDTLFSVTYTNGSTLTQLIPAGYYAFADLVTILQAGNFGAWTFTLSPQTFRVTITGNAAWRFTQVDVFTSMFGFSDRNVNLPNSYFGFALTQVSPNMADMQVHKYFYISIDQVESATIAAVSNTSSQAPIGLEQVICTCPLNAPFGASMHFEPPEHTFKLNGKDLKTLDFKVYGFNGKLLDLHGAEWGMRIHVNFSE